MEGEGEEFRLICVWDYFYCIALALGALEGGSGGICVLAWVEVMRAGVAIEEHWGQGTEPRDCWEKGVGLGLGLGLMSFG